MIKVYMIYLDSNVAAYNEDRYDDVNLEEVTKKEFKSKAEMKAFVKGMEFAGWSHESEFKFISKKEYKELKEKE